MTDGSAAGTSQVAALDLVSGGSGYEESDAMVVYKGALYFSGRTSGIYRSDGTAAGTSLVIPGIQGAYHLAVAGDSLYFATSQNGSEPWNPNRDVLAAVFSTDEIWRSDGTLAGTRQIYNEKFDALESYGISQMVGIKDVLFFLKSDRVHGKELWRCDGTREGTTLVQDIFPGPDSAFEAPVLSAKSISGNNFVFAARNELGTEPWVMPLDRRNVPAPALSVASTNIVAATGQPLSMPVTVVSGGPVQFTAHDLPPGVKIDPFTGLISGAPTFKGVYKATVDAMNGGATRSVRLLITVNDVPLVRMNTSYEAANELRLFFEGSPGTVYVFESSRDLKQWETKANVTQGSQFLVPLSELRLGNQFFRLRSK